MPDCERRVSAIRFVDNDRSLRMVIIEVGPKMEKQVKLHISPREIRAFTLAPEKG